jgi:hypothetical protein
MATCYHRLFHNTTTIDEGDNIKEVNGSYRLFLLFLKHKKKNNGSLLPLPSSLQHHHIRRQRRIAIVFFLNTRKKAMETGCHRLLRCNATTEEDNGALPSSSSSL